MKTIPFGNKELQKLQWYNLKWFTLLLALSIFSSCSKEEDEGAPQKGPDPNAPHSVNINAGSNVPVNGTLTAQYSDYKVGSDISKIADDDPQTGYTTNHSEFHIVFAASAPVIIDHYSLTSGSGTRSADPASWSLHGSNDNKNWTLLDKQVAKYFNTRYKTLEFEFNNEKAYSYYKLSIEENGGSDYTLIGEWKLATGSFDPSKPYSTKIENTSNMLSSSGTIKSQYSDSPQKENVSKLLDGNPDSYFKTGYNKVYLIWEPANGTYGNYYELTAANEPTESAPSSWKFYGSINGVSWELLDEQAEQSFEPGETKQFFCKENTNYQSYTHYKSYKLEIEGNNGADFTQLAEWRILYECRNLGDCLYLAENFKYSDRTPMGVEYEGIPPTTQDILDRLADPEVEPDITDYGDNLYWNSDIEVNLYPFGTPLPTDVNQHQIGNCSVLATFASIAYQYPEFIRNIIHENADGTYTVDMFDPQGKPVKVGLKASLVHPNDWAENPTWKYGVSGKNDATTWSSIIEKAMMKWESVFALYDSGANLGGMNASTTNPLFTGNGAGFSFAPGKLTSKQLTIVVKDALKKGMIVTGGFNTENQTEDGWTTTGHTWTAVIGNGSGALFALRNPWGNCADADDRKDGILNIYDDQKIPPTVGIDIYMPGAAQQYYQEKGLPIGRTTIYDIPSW